MMKFTLVTISYNQAEYLEEAINSVLQQEYKNIEYIIVDEGADEADNRIVQMIEPSDLVITADIPLADRTLSKGAHAIDHRGETYTVDNIKHYLAMRNLMESIRESGEVTKGPKPFTVKDAGNFANSLNNFLQTIKK